MGVRDSILSGIAQRAEAIRDTIGWTDYGDRFDMRQEVMDLCSEVARLAAALESHVLREVQP